MKRRSFLALLGVAPLAVSSVEASPELALKDAVQAFEKDFGEANVLEGLAGPYAQTGQQYVAITHAGVKPEGQAVLITYDTEAEAAKAWLTHARTYAAGRGSKLYWRQNPSAYMEVRDNKNEWYVYSRMLVTDLPEVQISAYDPVRRKVKK